MIHLSYIILFAILSAAAAFSSQSRSINKIPTRSIKVDIDDVANKEGDYNDILSSDRRKVLSQIAALSSILIPQSVNAEEDIITQLQNSLEERSGLRRKQKRQLKLQRRQLKQLLKRKQIVSMR